MQNLILLIEKKDEQTFFALCIPIYSSLQIDSTKSRERLGNAKGEILFLKKTTLMQIWAMNGINCACVWGQKDERDTTPACKMLLRVGIYVNGSLLPRIQNLEMHWNAQTSPGSSFPLSSAFIVWCTAHCQAVEKPKAKAPLGCVLWDCLCESSNSLYSIIFLNALLYKNRIWPCGFFFKWCIGINCISEFNWF